MTTNRNILENYRKSDKGCQVPSTHMSACKYVVRLKSAHKGFWASTSGFYILCAILPCCHLNFLFVWAAKSSEASNFVCRLFSLDSMKSSDYIIILLYSLFIQSMVEDNPKILCFPAQTILFLTCNRQVVIIRCFAVSIDTTPQYGKCSF